jgi:hypothetical protein
MQDRRSEVKNEVEAGGITSPYIFPGRQGRLVEDGGAKTARRGLLAAVAYGTGCRRGGRTLTRMGEVHEQGKGAGRRQSQGSDIVFRYSTCTPRTPASSGRQNDRRRGDGMSRYFVLGCKHSLGTQPRDVSRPKVSTEGTPENRQAYGRHGGGTYSGPSLAELKPPRWSTRTGVPNSGSRRR